MKLLLTLFVLAAFVFAASASAQRVVVTPKKVTYTRPKPLSKYKRTFTINYPKIKAATPALSAKIEKLLSYFDAFNFTLKDELVEFQWLDEADFEVTFSDKNVLSVNLSINGSGPYPDGTVRHRVIDTKTGEKLIIEFKDEDRLAEIINKKLQLEIAAAKKAIKRDKENGDLDVEDLFAGKEFSQEYLFDYSVTKDGVTFYFDYGFVHAMDALEPNGEFHFTWNEIKPFLVTSGSLIKLVP